MIIWLASYPRSGNTFFRILINHIYGIKTYSIHNDPLFDKLKGSSNVVGHQKLEKNYEEMATSEKLFFVKTHNLPHDNSPAIYLVRDGRDSLVSYAHYMMSFQNNSFQVTCRKKIKTLLGWNEYAEILNKLIVSSGGNYGNWSEHVKQWKERDSPTFVLKFEDLIGNPTYHIATAIEVIDSQKQFSIKNKYIPSFEELHAQWPQFFRKGKSGSWQQEMSQELQTLFWEHHGSIMKELGYSQ